MCSTDEIFAMAVSSDSSFFITVGNRHVKFFYLNRLLFSHSAWVLLTIFTKWTQLTQVNTTHILFTWRITQQGMSLTTQAFIYKDYSLIISFN